MSQKNSVKLYKQAGVDIEKADSLIDWLKRPDGAPPTRFGEMVGGIGGFSGLFRPNFSQFQDPLLIAGTDGVGTKVLLGIEHERLEGLGTDLVAMCVNDLYTVGGWPLFFLDYYAAGTLNESHFKAILGGIKRALKTADTVLLGGETAELPGLYAKGHFDLAGFVVGVVDGKKHLGPHLVKPDDVLLAFKSSGFHSNGYSLIRKWLKEDKSTGEKLIAHIMEPTKIYHEIPKMLEKIGANKVHAIANITGGGIELNLKRVLPQAVGAKIFKESIPTPKWMTELFDANGASFNQVCNVLNMGVGMIAVVAKNEVDRIIEVGREIDMPAQVIGELIPQPHSEISFL